MIRPPVAADKYYAASPAQLRAQLDACLRNAAAGCFHNEQATGVRGTLRGLIVPHGSLQDSGMVAAAAYQLLEAQLLGGDGSGGSGSSDGSARSRPPVFSPLLLLGTNHFTSAPAACLSSAAAWRTPLGDVPVAAALNVALAAAGLPTDDGPVK